MYDNYEDACEAVLTREQVVKELRKHGVTGNQTGLSDFFDEVGGKDSYTGKEVLDWLGF